MQHELELSKEVQDALALVHVAEAERYRKRRTLTKLVATPWWLLALAALLCAFYPISNPEFQSALIMFAYFISVIGGVAFVGFISRKILRRIEVRLDRKLIKRAGIVPAQAASKEGSPVAF